MMICFSYQQLSTNSVRDDLKVLQQRLEDRNQAKLDHIEKEKEAMMSKSTELRVAVEELEGGVMDLQSDNEQVAQETKYCVTEIGRQQGIDEDERNDIVRSLMAEKAVLESAIVGLQQKLQDQRECFDSTQNKINEGVDGVDSRSGSAESVASFTGSTPRDPELSIDMGDLRRISDTSIEPEIRQETEVLQETAVLSGNEIAVSQELALSELKQQLQDYRQQLEEFELAQKDWEGEKDALEGLVLSLRRQVKELQVFLGNSHDEEEISRLRQENDHISSKNKHLVEAWQMLEKEFVSLDISSSSAGNDSELDGDRMQLLREDLNKCVEKLREDNSLVREQTEQLIQQIDEKTSMLNDMQSKLEAKNDEVKSISDEKRDLMMMINERDERICEIEESFNNHLLDLTSSKDNEMSLLQTEQEDLVKLLEETRQECSLLRGKNNELLDIMGQNQQSQLESTEEKKGLELLLTEKGKQLENVEEERENFERMVQEKEKRIESLVAENNSMLMEKEVLQSLIEEYKEKAKVQEKQTTERSNLVKEIEQLNHKIQMTEARCSDLDGKQMVLLREKENLELELQQSGAKVDKLNSELKETSAEIDVLKEEKSKLIVAAESHFKSCKELEEKLLVSIAEKEEISKQLGFKDLQVDKLELDLREKGADIDLLKLDLAKLSKALKEKEQVIHTQVVNASNAGAQGVDDAMYRQAQLLRLLEEKDQEITALKQKDASLIELVNQTDQNNHQVREAYEGKLQQLREERDRLLDDLNLRNEELLTFEDKLDAMREKMNSKDQASHLLHNEHARLLALNESQANEMGKLRERNSALQKLVEEYNRSRSSESQRLLEDNDQLRRQIHGLQVEHETLTTLVQEKDKQISTLALLGRTDSSEPSPQGMEPQLRRLREERAVLLRERDSALKEKELKDFEISKLQEDQLSASQTFEEKCHLADKLLADNEDLSGQLVNLRSELSELSLEKSNLARSDNRLKELEEQINSFRNVVESKDRELKQVLDNSRNEKSSMLVELENVKSERDDILEQKYLETRELKNKILQLVRSVTDSESNEEENVDNIDINFQSLLHTVKNQRNSALRERDNEIQSLREQLSNVTLLNKTTETHGSELEHVLRDKEELHRMLLQSRNEKEDLLRENESTVAELQDQIVSLSRAVSEKDRSSHQDLQRVIQEKERIVNELEQAQRDREEVSNAKTQQQGEINRLQAELHDLKGVLTQERATTTTLHREVDQYKMAMQEKERIVKHLTVEREQLQRTQEKLQFRIQQLQEELTAASSGQKVAETKMAQELNRLRNHLVQVWQTSPSPPPLREIRYGPSWKRMSTLEESFAVNSIRSQKCIGSHS